MFCGQHFQSLSLCVASVRKHGVSNCIFKYARKQNSVVHVCVKRDSDPAVDRNCDHDESSVWREGRNLVKMY